MRRFILIIAMLCTFTSTPALAKSRSKYVVEGVDERACKYYLSVGAVFQNEAPYLKEWIEYYLLLGVEHFYLYNDNSQDNYLDVLAPYIDSKVVELRNWACTPGVSWTQSQEDIYRHCITTSTAVTRWLAIIDIDEYIVPMDRPTLTSFLQDYDGKKKLGGIMIFWQFYGTSWCSAIPDGKLMVECLTRKAHWHHGWNYQVKSIFKPHTVLYSTAHAPIHKKGYHSITTGSNPGPHLPQIDRIRVNHYWTKAADFFFATKIPRRELWSGEKFNDQQIQWYLEEFNREEDRSIFRFVPELRKKVFGVTS